MIKLNLSKNFFLALVLSIIAFLFLLGSQNIFPERFRFDSDIIRLAMNDNEFKLMDQSYGNTAKFYLFFGLTHNTDAIYFIIFSWTIFVFVTCMLLYKVKIRFNNNFIFLSYLLFALFYAAYFSDYAKDLVAILFLTLSLFFYDKKYFPIALYIVILLYAFIFRTYWFLFFAVTILINYLIRSKISIFRIIIFTLFIPCAVCFSYNLITHDYISDRRYNLNESRLLRNDENARTMTEVILPPVNILNDTLNCIYSTINLFIPIDGIGSPNELIYYSWLYIFIFCIKKNIIRIIKDYKKRIILCCCLAYIITQGFFEPDIGSAFRHQLPFYMFWLTLINKEKSIKNLCTPDTIYPVLE